MATIATSLLDDTVKSAIKDFCKTGSHKFHEIEGIGNITVSLQSNPPEILLLKISELDSEILECIGKIKNEEALKNMVIFLYLDDLDVKTEVALRKFKLSSFFLKGKDEKKGIEYLKNGISAHIRSLEKKPAEYKKGSAELADSDSEVLETHYNVGLAYMKKGLFDKALLSFSEAAKTPDMYFPATHMIGTCHYRLGRKDKAINSLLTGFKATGPKKERADLGYELGNVLYEIGRKKDALKVYEVVSKLDPKDPKTKKRISEVKKELSS